MASSRDTPNPLRPYYVPPSIGFPPDLPSSSSNTTSSAARKAAHTPSYASSARDMFNDIDYSDYLSDASPSTVQMIKELLDEALYKYTSILIAQPWENAKTVLQIRSHVPYAELSRPGSVQEFHQDSDVQEEIKLDSYLSEDSENDELSYFTSTAPQYKPVSPTRSRRRQAPERQFSSTSSHGVGPSAEYAPYRLILRKPDSLFEVISQLWGKEGAWGVWKGSNTTFVYSVALKTLENWARGLLAALFNVPDPGVVTGMGSGPDLLNSQQPWASLAIAVAAAALAGITLAPVDLVRTKLIITPTRSARRSLTQNLSSLPSLLCPPALFFPTLLNSIITPLMTHATPLVLRSNLSIDPIVTPTAYSISSFITSAAELFIKLPIETVLRRGQVSVMSSSAYRQGEPHIETIVEPGPYKGVFGTMWSIANEEGESAVAEKPTKGKTGPASLRARKTRKGQGVEGLCRGWRVGMWALIGLWSAGALGGAGTKGGEF